MSQKWSTLGQMLGLLISILLRVTLNTILQLYVYIWHGISDNKGRFLYNTQWVMLCKFQIEIKVNNDQSYVMYFVWSLKL